MRTGIIGVGRIGALHAETLHSLAEVDELVVVDSDAARAQKVASKMGVPWAPDIGHVLKDGADGIVIATPTDTHAGLVRAAAEAGAAVFCEKPVAADVTGTKEVVRLVEKTGAQVQVGFQRRFDAGFVSARDQVQAKKLGWLHTVRASTLDPAPPPAAYVGASGGIFRDCSVHDIDAVRWVTGREARVVYATGSNRGASYFSEAGDVDTAAALLTLDDGTLALVSSTRYNAAGYDVRLEVLGSEDSISAGLDDRLPLRSAEPGVTLETFYVAEACELSRRERRPVTMEEVRL